MKARFPVPLFGVSGGILPLADQCVTLSRHTAPTSRPVVIRATCQWANSSGLCSRTVTNQLHAHENLARNRSKAIPADG